MARVDRGDPGARDSARARGPPWPWSARSAGPSPSCDPGPGRPDDPDDRRLRELEIAQESALPLGEPVLAHRAVQPADPHLLAGPLGDVEVGGVEAVEVGAVGIRAGAHASRREGRSLTWGLVESRSEVVARAWARPGCPGLGRNGGRRRNPFIGKAL